MNRRPSRASLSRFGVLISPPNAPMSENPKSSATITRKFGRLAMIEAVFVLASVLRSPGCTHIYPDSNSPQADRVSPTGSLRLGVIVSRALFVLDRFQSSCCARQKLYISISMSIFGVSRSHRPYMLIRLNDSAA